MMGFRPEEKGIKTVIHDKSRCFFLMGFRPEEKGIKTSFFIMMTVVRL